jgi:hypothetical protein
MEVQKKWEGLEDSAMQIIQGHTTESTEREYVIPTCSVLY